MNGSKWRIIKSMERVEKFSTHLGYSLKQAYLNRSRDGDLRIRLQVGMDAQARAQRLLEDSAQIYMRDGMGRKWIAKGNNEKEGT
jgi:hypothetical protein